MDLLLCGADNVLRATVARLTQRKDAVDSSVAAAGLLAASNGWWVSRCGHGGGASDTGCCSAADVDDAPRAGFEGVGLAGRPPG